MWCRLWDGRCALCVALWQEASSFLRASGEGGDGEVKSGHQIAGRRLG